MFRKRKKPRAYLSDLSLYPMRKKDEQFGRKSKYYKEAGSNLTAFVALEIDEGKFLGIKIHKFGWTRSAGRILLKHYTTAQSVLDLMAEGDLIILGAEIKPKNAEHSYAEPEPGVCVYVHRDCRIMEPKPEMVLAESLDELKRHFKTDYQYLFRSGAWECSMPCYQWMPLEKAIDIETMFEGKP